MKTLSQRLRPLATAIACALLSFSRTLHAVDATTDPVGFVTVDYQSNTDSYCLIPFKRTPEYAGSIANVAGSVLTASGTQNFGNLVYASGTQPKTYFIIFTTGTLAGQFFTVTANTATTVTVDNSNGAALTSGVGSNFQIIPFDTLGSVFPAGQGIVPSPGFGLGARQTQILIPDNSGVGIDLAPTQFYYYYSGVSQGGPGWRSTSQPASLMVNDAVLYPDSYFIVRQAGTGSSNTFMGTVHMAQLATNVGTLEASSTQDNAIALPFSSDITLAQSKLVDSGAFTPSTGFGLAARRDELYVRDNTVAGQDKGADFIFYYYSGAAQGGPGWRRTDDLASNKHDTDVIFSTRYGVTLRKFGAGAATSAVWAVKPPYVP